MKPLSVARTALRIVEIRVRWLSYALAFTLGWLACAAWVFTLHFAPDLALNLIARAGGL